jgi:NDP-sugar pyrophosphorylase family protein
LILPSHRQGVRLLADIVPLSSVQFLGQSLIEYWLSHLAISGTKEAIVLVESPGLRARRVIGDGARWGLKAEVFEEPSELRPEQALSKFIGAGSLEEARDGMTVVDHFPEDARHPLFTSYADCFAALLNWMPRAKMPDRVGLREVQPGVWVNLPCHVSSRARLKPPCWVGKHVFAGAGAVIGPDTVLEEGAFIEAQAEVSHSWVGPDTLVGRGTRLANSIAIGSRLINYQTESLAVVPDPFVLCSLRRSTVRVRDAGEAVPLPTAAEEPSHWLWKALLLHKER